jgi:hypothetical protein
MDSVAMDRFCLWFLLVVLSILANLFANVVARALAASSLGLCVLTNLAHHTSLLEFKLID